jgi:hypothetical protein
MKIKEDIEMYKQFDPARDKSLSELSNKFGWSKEEAYAYKYFISEMSSEDLDLIQNCIFEIDLNVIMAVCIQNKKYHSHLFKNIDRINNADSPFSEIKMVISEVAGLDPLSTINKKYWLEVAEYLAYRHIDIYPFTKRAISFIKSIGRSGYGSLSTNQKKWIHGLILEDKSRTEQDRFFVNEHLIHLGYKEDCFKVENYEKCH